MSHGDDPPPEAPADFDIEAFHAAAVTTPSHDDVEAMRTLLVETLTEAGWPPAVDAAGNVVVSRGGDAADGVDMAGDGVDVIGDAADDVDVVDDAADGVDAADASTADTGPHIVLNTHLDTVSPHVPYERDGDVVRGRGACDAKGSLAALLAAFLRTDPGEGRLTLAVTTDEETTQTGGAHLAASLSADGYIVGEPTGLDVCTAARGQFEGTVTIHGESAHAADPGSGHNAIRAAAPILQAMESYDDSEAQSASEPASGDDGEPRASGPGEHETLGHPILTPSMVEGGEATNQVPAACTITFDRRSVPPETSESFCADLRAHLEQWLPESMGLTVELIRPDTPFPEAFATDADAELVRTLQEASGGAVRQFGAATEASYFAERGPTVVFGPGELSDGVGAVAHSKREYVSLPEVRTAARAVRETVERLV